MIHVIEGVLGTALIAAGIVVLVVTSTVTTNVLLAVVVAAAVAAGLFGFRLLAELRKLNETLRDRR